MLEGMRSLRTQVWAVWILLTAWTPPASAGPYDIPPELSLPRPFKVSGLVNFRYAYTSQEQSWTLGGPNKLRYGGRDIDGNSSGDRSAHVLAVPQASLIIDTPEARIGNMHLQVNLDADTDSGLGSLGLTEIYVEKNYTLGMRAEAGLRAGIFIPPISWEHVERGWSTRYTLTPSALGTWIAEEVRSTGVQGSLRATGVKHSLSLAGALFAGSDDAGYLLIHRGWTLHDFLPQLNASLPLPKSPDHPNEIVPFREKDGRPGFYGRADLDFFQGWLKLGGGYWDNNGTLGASSAIQGRVWSTQFWDYGAKLNWGKITWIAHGIAGRTAAAMHSRRRWESSYGLAAYHLRSWSLSARRDWFWVEGPWERGYAWTVALQYDPSFRQRLSLEYIKAHTNPGVVAGPQLEIDRLLQFNYRLRFQT